MMSYFLEPMISTPGPTNLGQLRRAFVINCTCIQQFQLFISKQNSIQQSTKHGAE
ncbi:hypothetical protein Hanom_Chr00s000449g01644121 [Helianthus anomalus]